MNKKSGTESPVLAIASASAATLGLILLVGGFLHAAVSDPGRAIDQEAADAYYKAASDVEHAAAMQSKLKRRGVTDPDQAAGLSEARERFAAARQEIEDAKKGNQSLAFWLRAGGAGLFILGLVGLLAKQSQG